jgi:hypothetical protein
LLSASHGTINIINLAVVVHLNFKSTGTLSTRLLLTHTNLADAKEMADLTKGWEWALSSLKSFLETGKGVTSE